MYGKGSPGSSTLCELEEFLSQTPTRGGGAHRPLLYVIIKSIGVGLDRLEATGGVLEASFSDFLSFLAIFGQPFWAILGPGGPQILGEESRFAARMVR